MVRYIVIPIIVTAIISCSSESTPDNRHLSELASHRLSIPDGSPLISALEDIDAISDLRFIIEEDVRLQSQANNITLSKIGDMTADNILELIRISTITEINFSYRLTEDNRVLIEFSY